MSIFPAPKQIVTAQEFFNPYAGLAPPQCCYCAPTGVVVDPADIEIQNQIQLAVNNQVGAMIPGLSSLSFTTKAEDAFLTLARGRIEARRRKLGITPGTAEMGHG